LVPVKFPNFDFGPGHFCLFTKNNADVSHESNMAYAMSLNPCHIMVFFADRSNEGLKPMGLNFTGANWMVFFLQGPKSKLTNFTGTKSTIYPKKYYPLFVPKNNYYIN
jgi:hypothetical protein